MKRKTIPLALAAVALLGSVGAWQIAGAQSVPESGAADHASHAFPSGTIALGGGTGFTSLSLGAVLTPGNFTTTGNLVFHSGPASFGPPTPEGAIFHQMVDRYFDKDGNQVEARSMTHVVDADCHSGRREEAIALKDVIHDDGKGNVRFGLEQPTTQLAAAVQ